MAKWCADNTVACQGGDMSQKDLWESAREATESALRAVDEAFVTASDVVNQFEDELKSAPEESKEVFEKVNGKAKEYKAAMKQASSGWSETLPDVEQVV